MKPPEQPPLRVLLEVVPTESLLAAINLDANLAGNPTAADKLSKAGMTVDADWPALRLGPSKPSRVEALAGRPRFDLLRETVNKVGETVGDFLPFDVPVPTWHGPERQTVLFRAELPPGEEAAAKALAVANEQTRIVGVYNDPPIALAQRRSTDPPHGTAEQVAELMNVAALRDRGLTGSDVPVVLVDSGLSLDYLRTKGREHPFDAELSYVPERSPSAPGRFPPGHGTLAAFQIGIAAPDATLVDHGAIIDPVETDGEPLMQAWLSDIEPGYVRLHEYLTGLEEPQRKLVVSNSWAMIRPDWDYPIAHVENFSDNPQHPFNRMVRALVEAGADVLFAAGNCGKPHPVNCGFSSQPICGANSLEEVITVGAVDIDGERLGYSSQGPGRIVAEKPDLCGYSHYHGSGLDAADWGTSTACPGVAGVVAAVRSRYSCDELPPAALKQALLDSARPYGGAEHSPDVGYGVVDPAGLLERLR